MIRLAALLLPVLLSSACRSTAATELFDVQKRADWVYVERAERSLSLFVSTPDGRAPAQGWPAVVFFHGGGWSGGSASQFFEQCEHLARRGIVGISAEYRLTGRDGTTPFDCVTDGKAALRYVRRNARQFGIDASRIAAGGGSAGGHVAAAVALARVFDEEPDAAVSCRPDALILFNPVYDNGPDGYGHARVKTRWREMSPIDNVRKGMPPSVVFLGTNDALVPVETAERFRDAAREAGSVSELYLYQDAPHGFFNRSRSERWFAETMEHMDRFLVALGWMDRSLVLRPGSDTSSSVGPLIRTGPSDPH